MANGAATFTNSDREAAYSDTLDRIQGADDLVSVYDQYADLQLSDLKKKLETRLGQATVGSRSALNFDLALYRSLRYAVASSRHCLVLGEVNNIRELYEGYRLRYPSENEAGGNEKLK